MPKSKPQRCAQPDCPMLGWFPDGYCPWHLDQRLADEDAQPEAPGAPAGGRST